MQKKEVGLLKGNIMANYYNRIMHSDGSFLAKIFGLFKLINLNIFFVIMENVVTSANPI